MKKQKAPQVIIVGAFLAAFYRVNNTPLQKHGNRSLPTGFTFWDLVVKKPHKVFFYISCINFYFCVMMC